METGLQVQKEGILTAVMPADHVGDRQLTELWQEICDLRAENRRLQNKIGLLRAFLEDLLKRLLR